MITSKDNKAWPTEVGRSARNKKITHIRYSLLEASGQDIGQVKWINTCILGLFHFLPPLTHRPALTLSGPMSSFLSEQRVVR